MEMELLFKWAAWAFQVLNSIATVGVWLYVRYGDRIRRVDDNFDSLNRDVDHRMDDQDKAIARLTGMIERAPTHGDLSKLYEKVNHTAQDVSHIAGEMRGINDNLRLILSRIAEKGL